MIDLDSPRRVSPSTGSLRPWFHAIAQSAGHELVQNRRRHRCEALRGESEGGDAVERCAGPPPTRFLAVLRHCIAGLPRLQRRILTADLAAGGVADARGLARSLRTNENSIPALRSMGRKALQRALLDRGYVPGSGQGQTLWN